MVRVKYSVNFFKQLAINKCGTLLSENYNTTKSKLTFKCANSHIWTTSANHIIEGSWCPICAKIKNRKYTVNDNFFSEDNELSFYVAGFFLADATKSDKGKSYRIRLRLTQKDIEHLKTIKNIINCTSPIKFEKKFVHKIGNKILDKTYYLCGFGFSSKQCYNDLERFGVIKNKTNLTTIPEKILINCNFRHFLRGLIDGDGCFTMDKNTVTFRLDGTKELLCIIHNFFVKNGICTNNNHKSIMEKKELFSRLMYGGNGIISRMYDFLYKDATIFLTRKEEIARRAKDHGKNKI